MHLKRLYHPRSDGDTPVVRGVRILRAKEIQNLSPTFLDGGEAEGWISRAKGLVTIHGELRDGTPKDLVYRIAETPGIYCCHTGKRIADAGDYKTAQQYIAENFEGATSPDFENPSGYRQNNAFSLVLIGDEVEDMTREEAQEMVDGRRSALRDKLRGKYGNTRADAEKRNAAKEVSRG